MRKHIANIKNEEDENEINLTPMLDVVFIMLIFFIVTASFIRESGLDVNRPDQDQAQVVQEEGAILVVIDSTDDIWIDNRIVDVRAVRANVERLHAEDPERPVVVQAAKASSADLLVSVMDAARQADIYDISIAAGD
ncbi:MAG: biopolymer transporter ExbD [Pseudomonadota bacterium]|nr:biopolymer transporter ExbD [Gammaproteobacteria bacterium]MEE2683911.1 biopolymer transporter ExbD [Pseudomonadota bacterium]|tara:strand:+ start:295 stop:705 length:411 start_codon:yes stop_codon:yes gene_type:complete